MDITGYLVIAFIAVLILLVVVIVRRRIVAGKHSNDPNSAGSRPRPDGRGTTHPDSAYWGPRGFYGGTGGSLSGGAHDGWDGGGSGGDGGADAGGGGDGSS